MKNNEGAGKEDRGGRPETEGKDRREDPHAASIHLTLHPGPAPLITAPTALREPLRGPSKQMTTNLR